MSDIKVYGVPRRLDCKRAIGIRDYLEKSHHATAHAVNA